METDRKTWVHKPHDSWCGAFEWVECWQYSDGRIHASHRVSFGGNDAIESSMRLSREQATFLRDRLTDILGHDAAYEAWVASREKSYGVGPLDIEDPASRFAADEPLPATDDEWKDRLVEGGA